MAASFPAIGSLAVFSYILRETIICTLHVLNNTFVKDYFYYSIDQFWSAIKVPILCIVLLHQIILNALDTATKRAFIRTRVR